MNIPNVSGPGGDYPPMKLMHPMLMIHQLPPFLENPTTEHAKALMDTIDKLKTDPTVSSDNKTVLTELGEKIDEYTQLSTDIEEIKDTLRTPELSPDQIQSLEKTLSEKELSQQQLLNVEIPEMASKLS